VLRLLACAWRFTINTDGDAPGKDGKACCGVVARDQPVIVKCEVSELRQARVKSMQECLKEQQSYVSLHRCLGVTSHEEFCGSVALVGTRQSHSRAQQTQQASASCIYCRTLALWLGYGEHHHDA